MTGVYLFAAAAGLPLLVWFLLNGNEDNGADSAGSESIGGVMFRLLPLSTLAIVAATFGVCGILLGLVDTDPSTTFLGATVAAVVAGVLNSTVFAYLRRSESTTEVNDELLAGAIGRVVLPVGGDHRGRVVITAGGQQVYLSARSLPNAADEELEAGANVLVVEVRNGVASVTRLDPELS